MYKEIAANPRVELAIPYAVGDNYKGYRIVGTVPEMFTKFRYRADQGFRLQPCGRFFEPEQREVVVGLLEPTNSPSDRVVWMPIEGIYRMSGHVLRGAGQMYRASEGEAIPDEVREVSAVMLKFKAPQLEFTLDQQVNRQGQVATLAWPIAKVMAELFDRIGWVSRILTLVAYLVVIVAAGSILASLYNTMNERRREFAILRAVGARRAMVFSAIVLEASTITALGALVGFLFYGVILAAAFVVVRAQTGVVFDAFKLDPALWLTALGMIAMGALAGLVPAFKAYRTDVASHLTTPS
jgi:putative ABC transport system permease protein